jgi:hypothetical protein
MESEIRPLHLHTLDSLCADLISGRAIGVGQTNVEFSLQNPDARSILYWYSKNRGKWAGNVNAIDVESIVDSIEIAPVPLPALPGSSAGAQQRYHLVKIQAHRFAGLHILGSSAQPPADFVFEPKSSSLTLFEGLNGSGKTSLLNAIIWALTGEILRPQRSPEVATEEFTCEVEPVSAGGQTTSHKMSSVTPLPNPSIERPAVAWVPTDTWVELSFVDEHGISLPVVKRTQSRTARGKLEEKVTGLEALALDPVAARTGTVMPGMLQFIQIGSESQLGKAVAKLTGMAPLVDLASHAIRAKKKIDTDFVKVKNADITNADQAYERSRTDLEEQVKNHPSLSYAFVLPRPSSDKGIEASLLVAVEHFKNLKAVALKDANIILGESFDATNNSARNDLEENIAPAVASLRTIGSLTSAYRLSQLGKLTEDELNSSSAFIAQIFKDASTLAELAANPARASRIRLYALIASWAKAHPDILLNKDVCIICGSALQNAEDPVTRRPVKVHLLEASSSHDAALLSQTVSKWASSVVGRLANELPTALQLELRQELPERPDILIKKALVEELFRTPPFGGVLKALAESLENRCNEAFVGFTPLAESSLGDLTTLFPELENLQVSVSKIDRAIRFSRWRQANQSAMNSLFASVVGQVEIAGRPTVPDSLLGKLTRLQFMVKDMEPITQAAVLCDRMLEDMRKRRAAEHKMAAYLRASAGLQECTKVGDLAEQQVKQLEGQLQKSAIIWRNRIYQGAFPSTNQDLVATQMNSGGQLEFLIGANGVSAPAQHVANASALRASLVGFFLAYWEYLLRERGGLTLLLLDDPQELLDGDNRERLADAMIDLVDAGAQLFLTTHDGRFARQLARTSQAKSVDLDFRYVHPATRIRGTLTASPNIDKVYRLHAEILDHPDDISIAQEYVSECRVFIEGRLGDLFDDAAFPIASATNFSPTLSDHLGRLRGLVSTSSNELFRSAALNKLCKDPALQSGAAALLLLNKAHHSHKSSISPMDVAKVCEDLDRICKDVERVHVEFRLYRRRERSPRPLADLSPLAADVVPAFNVEIQPDLAAFTRGAASGYSQDVGLERISSAWFENKAFYYLRSGNFGLSGPLSSIAIVEAIPSKVEDRCLTIARYRDNTYARRLMRSPNSELIALAAETPDPRRNPPTLLLHESDVALHLVVGMLFNNATNFAKTSQEALKVDGAGVLSSISTAYRIKEESAIPLALPGQIALGGKILQQDELDQHLDAYVALHLNDGSSILKRIGEKLPPPLSHLRRFESIGGLGVADILAVNQPQPGLREVVSVVLVIGVLYHG